MARAEASIMINRSVKDVWDYLDDPASSLDWESGLLEDEKTSEGPTQVGSTYRGVTVFLGRRLEWTSEIIELEPYRSVKFKAIVGSMPLEETRILEPVEGGTRFTFIREGEPRGLFRLADALVVRLQQRDMEAMVARLKDILEAEG